jgi:hypothetical protein
MQNSAVSVVSSSLALQTAKWRRRCLKKKGGSVKESVCWSRAIQTGRKNREAKSVVFPPK